MGIFPTFKKGPTRTDKVRWSCHMLQLGPLAKIQIQKIPRHAIAIAIGLAARRAELAEIGAVAFDDAANSANNILYDGMTLSN